MGIRKFGFTLLELIVVIIIIGILATVGLSQYTTIVEKSRGAEARANFGLFRQFHQQYYLANGTYSGETNSNVNIGTSAGQIPTICNSSYYFSYAFWQSVGFGDPVMGVSATRCTSGGKSPTATQAYEWQYFYNPATGWEWWKCYVSGAIKWEAGTPTSCP